MRVPPPYDRNRSAGGTRRERTCIADQARPPNFANTLGLPGAIQIIGGVLILDFSFGYAAHRLLHVFPVLWRFHRVHHSDEFVDATTAYRTHPVERDGVEHANIRLWAPLDHAASLVWVTPSVHKIHHSRARAQTNSNYGNLLTIYDRVFGTFTPSDRAPSVVYGLADVDPTRVGSFGALLSVPFEPEGFLTQKSGSDSAHTDTIPV